MLAESDANTAFVLVKIAMVGAPRAPAKCMGNESHVTTASMHFKTAAKSAVVGVRLIKSNKWSRCADQ